MKILPLWIVAMKLLAAWPDIAVQAYHSRVPLTRRTSIFQPKLLHIHPKDPIRRQRGLTIRQASSQPHEEDSLPSSSIPNSSAPSSAIRRHLLLASLITTMPNAQVAHARGLVQFPLTRPLFNRYHFLRTGSTVLEEQGIWSTNPLFLTNKQEDGLSDTGESQSVAACQTLKQDLPTLVKYSLAAACLDTATLLQRDLRMGRDKILPEFFFLDPRAIGQWDMSDLAVVRPAVWALDIEQAGRDGTGGRPPPNTDGTPHETLADQAVRLRQLLSATESQYSGETILLVFPDGTGPAVLSAMMAGVPLNRVHELEFAPGEVRMNVTPERVLDLLEEKEKDLTEYNKVIAQGKEKLAELRTASSTGPVVSFKESKEEEERIAIEEAYQTQKTAKRRKEEQERLDVIARQKEIVADGGRDTTLSPSILGAGGVVVVGAVAAMSSGGGETDEVDETPGSDDLTAANTLTAVATSNVTTIEDDPSANSSLPTDLKVDLYATVTQKVNGDERGKFVPVEDRKETAKRAMQDYLDEDDGGEAWLQVMSEILEEPDEEDLLNR